MILDTNLNSSQENAVTEYLQNRWLQLETIDRCFHSPLIFKGKEYQLLTFHEGNSYTYNLEKFACIYLYSDFRGNGKYRGLVEKFNRAEYKVLTFEDCELEEYLLKIKANYECIYMSEAYKIIYEYYKGKFAKRTGLSYMNHIHEGIMKLEDVNEQEVFMLHPIFQDGVEKNFDLKKIKKHVITLAKRYAKVANSYLPKDYEKDPPKIPPTVYRLLAVDKIQNYKDFILNKEAFSEEKIEQMKTYFSKWFKALCLSSWYIEHAIETMSKRVEVLT